MSTKEELIAAIKEIEAEGQAKFEADLKVYNKKMEKWEENQKSRTSLLYEPCPHIAPVKPRQFFPDPNAGLVPYPYQGFGGHIPSARLTEMRQPVYDTEILSAAATPNELVFCQRQMGQTTAAGGIIKTAAETSLSQPGQLSNPLEFDLAGFCMQLPKDIDDKDRVALYEGAQFMFVHTGNRIFEQCPLSCIPERGQIPQFIWPEGREDMIKQTREEMLIEMETREYGLFEYFVGKKLLRIKPTESFQMRISWLNGAPKIWKDIRITMIMDGLLHVPC